MLSNSARRGELQIRRSVAVLAFLQSKLGAEERAGFAVAAGAPWPRETRSSRGAVGKSLRSNAFAGHCSPSFVSTVQTLRSQSEFLSYRASMRVQASAPSPMRILRATQPPRKPLDSHCSGGDSLSAARSIWRSGRWNFGDFETSTIRAPSNRRIFGGAHESEYAAKA